jgi:hypothetical protein
MSTAVTTPTRTAAPASRVLRAGVISGVVAGVANVIIFFVAKALGVPFEVKAGASTMKVIFAQPLLASIFFVFLGAVVLWLLTRLSRGVMIWTVVASVILVAYTAFAFSAATATSTGLSLTLMHLVAFASAFVLLRPAATAA